MRKQPHGGDGRRLGALKRELHGGLPFPLPCRPCGDAFRGCEAARVRQLGLYVRRAACRLEHLGGGEMSTDASVHRIGQSSNLERIRSERHCGA